MTRQSSLERLLALQVADAMSREVVVVSAHEPLIAAARRLMSHGYSGAPVVDEQGRCVGVLSAADFMRLQGRSEAEPLEGQPHALVQHRPNGAVLLEPTHDELVSAHMSQRVVSVTDSDTLLQAARLMCAAHAHRLPVLDAHGRPVGVISSLDLVAAMVNMFEQ